MTNASLYKSHLETLDKVLADALERAGAQGLVLDGVLFHAGRAETYHVDDKEIPFESTPHFRRWIPLAGPEHVVLARPGRRPFVVRVNPRDYWYEAAPVPPSYWQEAVQFAEVTDFSEVAGVVGSLSSVAYVGNSPAAASELGIDVTLVEPEALMKPLDWHRATKTAHEVALVEAAARKAAEGHRVGRKAFEGGASEREIHYAYLQATGQLEHELPFETIIALDAKSATLHYHTKRGREAAPGKVFLLDAGASHEGYASDITRTWALPGVDPVFIALLEGVDELERDLVAMVTPGRPYLEVHLEAHRRVAALLSKVGVSTASPEETLALGISRTFLPHGVGHHLGIQVHDIGGRQASPDGGLLSPPPDHPFLRNTRTLEPGHLVTIEPGIYFIPMLLEKLRESAAGARVDWALVDRLTPFGGIRIEDDVLCTPAGARDLTRPLIQGPRGA